MEKFAVDLDKVLDEFEFNEDHAEQIAENATSPQKLGQSQCLSRVYKHLALEASNSKAVTEIYQDGQIPSNSDTANHNYTHEPKNKLQHQKPNKDSDESIPKPSHNNVSQTFIQKRPNESCRTENSYDKKLNQPNIKPSVSNVFSSLNEYINAPGASIKAAPILKPINIGDININQLEKETVEKSNGKDNIENSKTANQLTKYQNILLPVKVESRDNVQGQSSNVVNKEVDSSSNSNDLSLRTGQETKNTEEKSKCVYENVHIETDVPNRLDDVEHTYENIDFDSREKNEDTPYECIYLDNQKSLPETTTELKTVAKKMTDQLSVSNVKSKLDDSTKLVFQNVHLGPPQTKTTQSSSATQTIGFSSIDDLSEEELNKYLAELEAEERANENIAVYENVATCVPENSNCLPKIDDEDKNEAPIFESVTIGELPSVSEEDLQEKAKKFPVIDYSKPIEKPTEEVISSKRREEPVGAVLEVVTEKIKSKKSKSVHEKTRKNLNSSDSTSSKSLDSKGKEAISVEEKKEEKNNENNESKELMNDAKKVEEVSEKREEDEKEVDTKELKDNRSECVVNVNKVDDSVDKINERPAIDDNACKSDNQVMVNNIEHRENSEDDGERPPRPQTLDIIATINMIENFPIGMSSNVFGSQEAQDSEVTETNNRPPSPDVSENSSTSGTTLGKQPPFWIPDSDAPNCMLCDAKFTVIKRRHHCRACGKVLCNKCCNMRYKLEYQGNIDSRVCLPCHQLLIKAESEQGSGEWSAYSGSGSNSGANSQVRQPNPNNPMEYCSTIPPLQQLAGGLPPPPPTVMVPVGVLKREGSNKQRAEGPKSVMFSDGIRPGCDLTELDSSWDLKPPMKKPGHKRISSPGLSSSSSAVKRQHLPPYDPTTNSYIPSNPGLLPPTVTLLKGQITYHDVVDQAVLYTSLKNECEPPVIFAINRNLYACVKITNLNCCVNRVCWNITSKGLACVGQDEVIFLIETLPDETQVPKDILLYINQIYHEAVKGNTITEYGVSIHQSNNLLGSREHAGFLFIRQTLQCLQKIILPPAPFLVALLVHRWETPWAKVFPLRLVLRLGAEYRYYPCPLVSVRFRDAVYFEIGHTVMKLLADFRNFAYTLPGVRGLTIHMQDRTTIVRFPKNRYDQVIKGLNNSNDHVLAYASNFSVQADSHLVCIQKQTNSEDESSYQTQAINIQNKPRKVTGASFIVINGALKSSMGLTAKSSIVEDGLMVQILPEKMEALKAALKNMQDFDIGCGKQGAPEPDEIVSIKWVENDVMFNLGVKSPIDGKPLNGVPSIRVHNGMDYMGTNRCIRWTEVFIIKADDHPNGVHDPVDINKLSESIARATCVALVKLLDLLATAGLTKLAVRTTIHPDNVGYEAGSEGTRLPPIYMKSLDNELIQVLQKTVQSSQDTHTVLELVFYVLETENYS